MESEKTDTGVAIRPSGPNRLPVGIQHSFEDGKFPLSVRSFERCYLPVAAVHGTASTLHSRCIAVFHSRRDYPRSTSDAGGDLELSRGPRRYRGVRSLSVLVVAQGEVPKPKGFMIPGVAETKRARRACTGIFAFVLLKKLSTPSFKTV